MKAAGNVAHRITRLFDQAAAHHHAGRLTEAEPIYRQILSEDPRHADSIHLLGVIAYQRNNFDLAVALISKAIALNDNAAGFHSNLGLVLKDQGRLDEAATCFKRALSIEPESLEGLCNLGTVLDKQGMLNEAIVLYQHAIAIKPNSPEVLSNLGTSLTSLGRLDEAIASCKLALALKPTAFEGHIALATIFETQGKYDTAIEAYQVACRLRPDNVDTHFNLANALRNQRKPDEAIFHYQQALTIRPIFTEAICNCGTALVDQGQLGKAITHFKRALALSPGFPQALANLACAFRGIGRLDEAILAYRQALAFQPDFAEAFSDLGLALQDQGNLDAAVASYKMALAIKPNFPQAHSNLLLSLNYIPELSPVEVFVEHLRWARRHGGRHLPVQNSIRDRNPARRLRIGYISPDFRQHSVMYFLEPLLRAHDHQQFEIFCYSDVAFPDAVTLRLSGLADHWFDVAGIPDEMLLKRIDADEIDILIDLAGHTNGNRLLVFERKPAPVQASWLGYPNTTGLSTIDYRLVDAVSDPPDTADALSSEKLLRLERGFLCYAPPADAPLPAGPPGLACGWITFGSLNNPSKLSSATLDTWAALLDAVPGSRLLVKGKMFAEPGGRAAFLTRLAQRGVKSERLTMMGLQNSVVSHLECYHQVDIAVDPIPYNGTTTTCEALWMGVPVITLLGDRHAGRVGASLLTQVGMTELIASSVQEYVRIASFLAGNRQRLTDFHQTLRSTMARSALCDSASFTHSMEAAYRVMWQAWCADSDL